LTKHELPTPSLLLDLDRFEANLERMSRHAKAASISLRPHAKTHKCVDVARRQIQAGALGVCVATIREAEVMAAAGITGLLITCEMIGPEKIGRLVRLTREHPGTMSVADNAENVAQLSQAAASAGVSLNVLLDVDPGNGRTGIAAGDPAFELGRLAGRLPNLNLRGIHCYSGASSHVVGFAERTEHSRKAMLPAIETFFRLRESGLPVDVMTGGSTGTYNIDPQFKGMTELQVGSYAFMDLDYRRIGGESGPVYEDFAPALTVLATVISTRPPDRATVDAGFKAFATDRKFGPEVVGCTGVSYRFSGDEHGILDLQNPSRAIRLGDRLEFLVPHCDPSVNLYNHIHALRGDRVEAVWPVANGHA